MVELCGVGRRERGRLLFVGNGRTRWCKSSLGRGGGGNSSGGRGNCDGGDWGRLSVRGFISLLGFR